MIIERILYGMQTSDGKILTKYSNQEHIQQLLTPKSRERIKSLRQKDSRQYLWFRTEQTIAYPVIIEVTDKDPTHGGRTWVQNQTFLVNIHDFINHFLNNGNNLFESLAMPELEVFPSQFEPIEI